MTLTGVTPSRMYNTQKYNGVTYHVKRIPYKMGAVLDKTNSNKTHEEYHNDAWWSNLRLAKITNGTIKGTPEPLKGEPKLNSNPKNVEEIKINRVKKDDNGRNNKLYNQTELMPFQTTPKHEPVITVNMKPHAPLNIYIDTGADADVISTNILDANFPGWRASLRQNKAKLIAANETRIHHIGTCDIKLPIQGGSINIRPFVTEQDGSQNTMILGYKSMRLHNLVPIPGKGLLRANPTLPGELLATKVSTLCNISKISMAKPSNQVWVANPKEAYEIPAYKRITIMLVPRSVDKDLINSANGTKLVARRCDCLWKTGEECAPCLTDSTENQLTALHNNEIPYVYDNTGSGTRHYVDQAVRFYISFPELFKLDQLAKLTLETLDRYDWDINPPENQYTEDECLRLFNKTKEEVTKSLRSIIAEPESWSIQGFRPATLRMINSEGDHENLGRAQGVAIPFDAALETNPCSICRTESKYYCNMENPDCKLREICRYQQLPTTFSCTLQVKASVFHPNLAEEGDAVVGCSRRINKHSVQWFKWYKNAHMVKPTSSINGPERMKCKLTGAVTILHTLTDAVVTEVSKSNLITLSEYLKKANLKRVHFTNFAAYGISKRLLQRCISHEIDIVLYHSEDIQVAKVAFDPRKNKNKMPTPKKKPTQEPKAAEGKPLCIEPGMSKPIRSAEMHTQQANNDEEATIMTNDENLKERCKKMLEAHKKVFAVDDSDCGLFWDPETKQPYKFHITLRKQEPPSQKARFISPVKEKAATALLTSLLNRGIIKRRYSPYNSQSVFVPKKPKVLSLTEHLARGGTEESFIPHQPDPLADVKLRHCVDFKLVNEQIIDTPVATLSPKQILARLAGVRSCATLDLCGAYLALALDSPSELVCGFDTGTYSLPSRHVYARSSMGCKSSAAFLSAGMAKTLAQASGACISFCDDVLVTGKDNEEVLANLSSVLDLLEAHNWRVRRHKMAIFTTKLHLFGMNVNLEDQTISAPRSALDAVLERGRPESILELRSALGAANWFGEVLHGHTSCTARLHKLCRKNSNFAWTDENLEAYEDLLDLYSRPEIFNSMPNYDLTFELISDSSEFGTGTVLGQFTPDGEFKINAYTSHIHDERIARMSPHEREAYGMVTSVAANLDIIAGRKTVLHTDSRASVLIGAFSKVNSKINRWLLFLKNLPWLSIRWISSKSGILQTADFLSRRPAGAVTWKNKSPTKEDIELMSLAAGKLKRDTEMTIKHHEVLLDFICSKTEDELHNLEDDSVTISASGEIMALAKTDKDAQHMQLLAASTQETKEPEEKHYEHVAFKADKNREVYSLDSEPIPVDCDVNGMVPENGLTEHTPPGAEPYPSENMAVQVEQANPDLCTTNPGLGAGRCSPAQVNNYKKPTDDLSASQASIEKILRIKYEDKFVKEQSPRHLISIEDAENIGMLDPASQSIEPPTPEFEPDRPPLAKEDDTIGKVLDLTFQKSPHMRWSTLIAQQKGDPVLAALRNKCSQGPILHKGATFLLKHDVLLRTQTKNGLENHQVCLPKQAGYNLALKSHLAGNSFSKGIMSGPLHSGAPKMQSCISQRFYIENLKNLCMDIVKNCEICSELKDSPSKTRADAKRSIIRVDTPATVWCLDLLALPKAIDHDGYILTACCLFSRFTIAIPLDKPATSEYIFYIVHTHILGVHGRARTLVVDNASYFTSEAMRQCLSQLNVTLRCTPVYSARSNISELSNKFINKNLRIYHNTHQVPYSRWRCTLPLIMCAFNYAPFSGPLGQVHKLSPALLFYGHARINLDPAMQFDMPYLEHVYKNHIDFVEKTAKAAWATTQIMREHRLGEMNRRGDTAAIKNKVFSKRHDFKLGDIILVERHHSPGVLAKLRPRASFRFVVLYTTETMVFCRPWSTESINRWASAQKYTLQNKNAIVNLPVIAIPKERAKLDKSLHLWTENRRIPEKSYITDLSQPDPDIQSLEVEDQQDNDWITLLDVPEEEVSENDEDASNAVHTETLRHDKAIKDFLAESSQAAKSIPSAKPSPKIPAINDSNKPEGNQKKAVTLQVSNEAPEMQDITPISNKLTKANRPSILQTEHQPRRSKRRKTAKVSIIKTASPARPNWQGKRLRRFMYTDPVKSLMSELDDLYAGRFNETKAISTYIPPRNIFPRMCDCKACFLQISQCKSIPCIQCVRLK